MTRREGDVGVMLISPKVFKDYTLDQIEQIAFHEVAHTAEWKFTTWEEWDAEQDALLDWLGKDEELLPMTMTAKRLSEAFDEQGISYEYDGEYGMIAIKDKDLYVAFDISDYAVSGADYGMQDSELVAEAIRYKANYPNGGNKVAEAVAKKLL